MKKNVKFVRYSYKIANLDNNLTFIFILQSKKSLCQTPTTHTKISQVISVTHVQHSLRMDH